MARKELTRKQAMAAEHYVLHGSKTEAYVTVYRAKPGAVRNGQRAYDLFRLPHVAAYVEELKAQAMERAVLTRTEGLVILSEIARGKVPAYLTADGEIDPAKVAAHGGSDIEAYSTQPGEHGTSRKLKVRNPVQAIERLSRMLGWDKPVKLEADGVIFNLNLGGSAS